MEADLSVRQLTADDMDLVPAAHLLLNRTQGVGLFPADFLPGKLANPACHVVAAFSRGELAGVALAELLTDFAYYEPFVLHGFNPKSVAGLKVGSFSSMSVAEGLQGQGIGKILAHLRLDWLKEEKCDLVLGVSWVSGLAHTSARVFDKLGFQVVAKCHDFYRLPSLERPFDCPGCKASPCACAALLYRLDLRTQKGRAERHR